MDLEYDNSDAVDAAAFAGAETSTHGLDSLHVMSPAEILARKEEPEDEEMRSVDEERDSLFLRATEAAVQGGLALQVDGLPALDVMGMRVWIMLCRYCARLAPRTRAADRRMMQRITDRSAGRLNLGAYEPEEYPRVLGFIAGRERSPRAMGRRVSLLAYAGNKSPNVRAALPSMEVIGELWQLRADNKRSAVCAALGKIRDQVQASRDAAGIAPGLVQFFFQKRPETVAKYAAVQMGNSNRQDGMHANDDADHQRTARREAAEVRNGIPVRAEFAKMTPDQLRARLRRLHDEADLRRLAGL